MDAAEEEPRYFQSRVAEHLNVPAAVIYYNFCHWIGECKERKVEVRVKLSPATLVELLPFSESTIKRCLKTLKAQDYIQSVLGKICWYAENPQLLRGSNPDEKGPNPDEKGPNPDEKGPNPDEKGPNPDNYIDCNELVDELEKNSKPKPAASVFENPADAKKANDDKSHLFDDGIVACADEQDREKMRHEKITSGGPEFNSSSPTSQTRSFSFFDAPISSQPAGDASVSKVHPPSTADIADEVEHVEGKWPMVDSLEELHQMNCNNANAVEHLVLQPDTCETFCQTVTNICAKTMAMINLGITDEFYDNPDGDEIIEVLLPHFHQFLDQTTLDPYSGLSQIIYHAALECMVGSFLWKENKMGYTHPIRTLIGVTYKLSIVLWRRSETLREQAVKEEFDQWSEEYASVDAHKENDADLSPAEKMRVFRNALSSRNKVGWISFEQKHETHLVKITKLGLQRIQKLFELNVDLTPSDLLPVIDGCINEYVSRPVTKNFKRGVHWHARMGHRLHFFASYLETIVKQLGVKSPVEVYLSEARIHEEAAVALAA